MQKSRPGEVFSILICTVPVCVHSSLRFLFEADRSVTRCDHSAGVINPLQGLACFSQMLLRSQQIFSSRTQLYQVNCHLSSQDKWQRVHNETSHLANEKKRQHGLFRFTQFNEEPEIILVELLFHITKPPYALTNATFYWFKVQTNNLVLFLKSQLID